MAYLDENAAWEEGIYQWETQDPVVGGPDGIDNVPTRQLANRTGYLKEQIAAHAAATDPHPQYMTQTESDSRYSQLAHNHAGVYEPAGTVQTHVSAADPHPQYFLRTDAATVSATLKSTTDTLNQHVASASHFATGTRLMFAQAAAPTGWVQITSDLANNRMLRVVASTGAGTGGTHSPVLNNVVPAHTHGFSTGGQSADHSHSGWTGGQSADHSHGYETLLRQTDTDRGGGSSVWSIDDVGSYTTGGVSSDHGHYITTGGVSSNHTHSGSTDNGSSQTNWTPRYIDLILCERQ